MRMSIRRTATAVAATVAVLSAASPALAAEHSGACDSSELCLYYNSNVSGSLHDFYNAVPDFRGYTFISSGAGAGQGVKNNAASARNNAYWCNARVYYNSNYAGVYDEVKTRSWRNLTNTYNDNASFNWKC